MGFSKDLKMFNHRVGLGAKGRGRGVRGGAGVEGWEQKGKLAVWILHALPSFACFHVSRLSQFTGN